MHEADPRHISGTFCATSGANIPDHADEIKFVLDSLIITLECVTIRPSSNTNGNKIVSSAPIDAQCKRVYYTFEASSIEYDTGEEQEEIIAEMRNQLPDLIAYIDQQAARIAELDGAVSGPLENITKMLETVNADTIFAGVIQTWKNENMTLKLQITDLEKRNADLEARVAALKEIAGEERAAVLACFEDAYGVTEEHRLEARRQLAKEHPEAFR